ncbi:MAG TPA: tetratricopeptide repeat protein [Ktedonobacterales bacterium]
MTSPARWDWNGASSERAWRMWLRDFRPVVPLRRRDWHLSQWGGQTVGLVGPFVVGVAAMHLLLAHVIVLPRRLDTAVVVVPLVLLAVVGFAGSRCLRSWRALAVVPAALVIGMMTPALGQLGGAPSLPAVLELYAFLFLIAGVPATLGAGVGLIVHRGALRSRRRITASQYAEALAVFEQALALDPTDVRIWLGVGTALRGLHRDAEALAAFERLLAVYPSHACARRHKAATLHALGRTAEASKADRCAQV